MSRDLFLQGYGQVGGLDFNPFRSHKENKKILSLEKKNKERNASWFWLFMETSIQISFLITETVHPENVHIWGMQMNAP